MSGEKFGHKPFYFLKRGLDRASKSVKFVKESNCMTRVLGIKIACCGETLRASEHFQRVYYRQVSLQWFNLHKGKSSWSICFVSRNFHSLLAGQQNSICNSQNETLACCNFCVQLLHHRIS